MMGLSWGSSKNKRRLQQRIFALKSDLAAALQRHQDWLKMVEQREEREAAKPISDEANLERALDLLERIDACIFSTKSSP